MIKEVAVINKAKISQIVKLQALGAILAGIARQMRMQMMRKAQKM
jgi:hypothetical protein